MRAGILFRDFVQGFCSVPHIHPQRMMHLPFSTQGLFFISSGFRKGSSGIPSSIHFTNLQRGEGGWAQPHGGQGSKIWGFVGLRLWGKSCRIYFRDPLMHTGVSPALGQSREGTEPVVISIILSSGKLWKGGICTLGGSQGSGGSCGAATS